MAAASSHERLKFEEIDIYKEEMKAFRANIREDDAILQESMEILQILLLEQENLNPCLDEDFLLRFLRKTEFDCEMALKRIENYYRLRGTYPEIFGEYYPSSTERAQKIKLLFASPYRADDGALVIIYKLGIMDPEVVSFEEFIRLSLMIIETLVQNPVTQVCGCKIIVDLNGVTPQKTAELTPRRRRMITDIFEFVKLYTVADQMFKSETMKWRHLLNSFSLPITKVYGVNVPQSISTLYTLLISSMREWQKDLVKVFSVEDTLEALHSELSPDVLPTDYGGCIESSDMIELSTVLKGRGKYFLNMQQYCMLDLSQVQETFF